MLYWGIKKKLRQYEIKTGGDKKPKLGIVRSRATNNLPRVFLLLLFVFYAVMLRRAALIALPWLLLGQREVSYVSTPRCGGDSSRNHRRCHSIMVGIELGLTDYSSCSSSFSGLGHTTWWPWREIALNRISYINGHAVESLSEIARFFLAGES